MFVSNGILFNHESPLRGETFVTRKITRAVVRIAAGVQSALYLGNLDAQRDWGHAADYVHAMWRMLQHHTPDDFVIATGNMYSVREFVEAAFACVGIAIAWKGSGAHEVGFNIHTEKPLVFVDQRYLRPIDVHCLLGDARKAREQLGWQPTISFGSLVQEMVAADTRLFCGEVYPTETQEMPRFWSGKKGAIREHELG
jgi:GDPmannose 4,6-dehydratase